MLVPRLVVLDPSRVAAQLVTGTGLIILATLATAAYYLVALAFPLISRRLPGSSTAVSALGVRYPDGRA